MPIDTHGKKANLLRREHVMHKQVAAHMTLYAGLCKVTVVTSYTLSALLILTMSHHGECLQRTH